MSIYLSNKAHYIIVSDLNVYRALPLVYYIQWTLSSKEKCFPWLFLEDFTISRLNWFNLISIPNREGWWILGWRLPEIVQWISEFYNQQTPCKIMMSTGKINFSHCNTMHLFLIWYFTKILQYVRMSIIKTYLFAHFLYFNQWCQH